MPHSMTACESPFVAKHNGETKSKHSFKYEGRGGPYNPTRKFRMRRRLFFGGRRSADGVRNPDNRGEAPLDIVVGGGP